MATEVSLHARATSSMRADVQGLRALAVLLVVAFHAGLPIPGGFAGVDVFFVISGFVITGLILREIDARQFSFRRFYSRRVKRLLPALMLMLITVLVLSFLLESPLGPQQTTAMTALGATVLIANHVIMRTSGDYFDAAANTNPLLHVWSLSVEEQFYLGFPALVLLACMIGRRGGGANIRSSAIIVAALTGASFSFSLVLSYADGPLGMVGDPTAWAFYSAPSRGWEFGVGALVALWAHSRGIARVTSGRTGSIKAVIVASMAVLLVLGGNFLVNDATP